MIPSFFIKNINSISPHKDPHYMYLFSCVFLSKSPEA